MQKRISDLYTMLVTLPDKMYPFRTEIEGQWVRGVRSYNATVERLERLYGVGHYGYLLDAYRQIFHFVGSILFLIVAAYASQHYFGGTNALYVFLGIAVLFITFQEFYLHRRMYRQIWIKSVVDWVTWCLPIGVYVATHFK